MGLVKRGEGNLEKFGAQKKSGAWQVVSGTELRSGEIPAHR